MSRENYYISVNGTLVEVTEEQHLCYYRSKCRMRYFEHDIKTETAVRDKTGNITGYTPSKEDSLNRLCDMGEYFADTQESVEDAAIRVLMSDKLHEALDKLTVSERELIDALFFADQTEREYAKALGVRQQSVNERKSRILSKLKNVLNN